MGSPKKACVPACCLRLISIASRRRTKKPNKVVSISKYQSYHRHHLIRISSCHKLQLRAKKTKKNEFFSIPIETANYEKKIFIPIENQSRVHPVAACIQFFWKVVLLPSRIVREKFRTEAAAERRRTTTTSPTSMLLVILFGKVPAVFNIFCCQI